MRQVNNDFDTNPSLHHRYIFKISKSYIENKVVLDIGCWTGQYTQLGVKIAKKIHGIDPSSEAISFAKKYIPKAELSVGNALRLRYPDEYFDVVILSEVLEHVPPNTELKVFKEIRRVLKKNGILILSTPYKNFFSILLDPAYFLLNHRHYSKADIKDYLDQSNFQISTIYTNKGFAHLLLNNIELLFKYTTHTKPSIPKWINELLKKEINTNGFATVYAIAKAI